MILFQSCNGQTKESDSKKPNFIDSIQTATQLSDLISKVDSTYKDFEINEELKFENSYSSKWCKKIADSLNVQPWTKADFDNNGLTDILVVGNDYSHCVICILDKGDKYELKRITKPIFQDCTFPIVENNTIKYFFEGESEDRNKSSQLDQITLIYKFGDFIEETKTSEAHKIEKIEYSTSGCYGTCPIFKLSINFDRTSKWTAEMYNEIDNKELTGNFQTTISKDKYDEIVNLLNYIDFTTLKDSYAVRWTDDQSSTLKITYENGKTKIINDYGLIGTFGLNRVYQLLFDLRENQIWRK